MLLCNLCSLLYLYRKHLIKIYRIWRRLRLNTKVDGDEGTPSMQSSPTLFRKHTFILSNVDKQQTWQTVEKLLTDNQVEVREHAAAVLAGLMKGGDEDLVYDFRRRAYGQANLVLKKRKPRSKVSAVPMASIHGSILALAACVLSVPYDMPSWLPDHVTLLALFVSEPSPLKSTVTKAIAEFRRTHADMWNIKKESFTEE